MEKSIEKIWQQGFINNEALIAPKVNNLYNKKSEHLIDKMKRMFRLNGIYVIGLAVFLLIISVISGVPWAGICMIILFLPLVVYGQKQIKEVEKIDKGVSGYEYLYSFNGWLKAAIAGYTKIYRFFYPLFLLTLFFGYWYSDPNQHVVDEINKDYPNAFYIIDGLPLYGLAAAISIAILSAIFAGKIYQWDMNTIYGQVFQKLDEILADMEELRK